MDRRFGLWVSGSLLEGESTCIALVGGGEKMTRRIIFIFTALLIQNIEEKSIRIYFEVGTFK